MNTVSLINDTSERIRLAVFKQPTIHLRLDPIAWHIAAPRPNGGHQTLRVPSTCQVFARFPSNRGDLGVLDRRTHVLDFDETTARFDIDELVTIVQRVTGASITRRFDELVDGEVRVRNNCSFDTEVTIALDHAAVYAPHRLRPGALFIEDIRGPLYVAVVSDASSPGARLVPEKTSRTQLPLPLGGSVHVRGSQWFGYTLAAR
jgi:hypothetical protein